MWLLLLLILEHQSRHTTCFMINISLKHIQLSFHFQFYYKFWLHELKNRKRKNRRFQFENRNGLKKQEKKIGNGHPEELLVGLLQHSVKGWQPVHFISPSLTDVEKRYSQTEKDALSVKWTKDRFSMFLQGAPRFTIVTAHKPLLSMFGKPTVKRLSDLLFTSKQIFFLLVKCHTPGRQLPLFPFITRVETIAEKTIVKFLSPPLHVKLVRRLLKIVQLTSGKP